MAREALHDLSDLVVLITGAGRSASLYLARCGAVVGAVDIDGPGAEETAAQVRDAGGQAHAFQADLSSQTAFEKVAAELAARCGRMDAVVNNAALLHYEPLEAVNEATVDRMLGAGFKSAVWGSQALLRHMRP